MTTAPVLETRDLCRTFGSLVVADNIGLRLEPGARHALIGPNGAGKTTLVNLISGALSPSAGSVWLDGADVTGLGEARRARAGIARTFQINRLFADLTVLENLALAVGERREAWRDLWRPLGRNGAVLDEAMALLRSLGLDEVAGEPVGRQPYGRQRLIELALALAARPRVLLLDEPAAGVPSAETHRILDAVAGLDAEIAVLIIEHDMEVVFRFAKQVTVLVAGRIFAEGSPAEIADDERVRDIYLGHGHDGQ